MFAQVNNQTVIFRTIAALMVTALFLFLIDNTLIYWFSWPGVTNILTHWGLLQPERSFKPLVDDQILKGVIQISVFFFAILLTFFLVFKNSTRSLAEDSSLYTDMAAFIVRAAFWAIFLVGLVDMVISFLRVEEFLAPVVGEYLNTQLGRSVFRGSYVHFPLIIAAVVIACFSRSLGFIWLASLIVIAEFIIVITRFIFSYEQAFMGDLVRFWYAGLFLFSSAYTLLHDGHVRVDVLYANFSERGKALTNSLGSLLLGLPLCWNILIQGTSGKGSIINSPLLSFEISQSGFGMYTKYLMAGYLLIFALSMAIQFVGFALSNIDILKSNHLEPNTTIPT